MSSGDRFNQAEDKYFRLKGQLAAGRITQAQFDAALKDLMFQDAHGRYWMIGGDSGKWYFQDGQNWVEQNPTTASAAPPSYAPSSYVPAPSRGSNVTMLIAAGVIVVICLLGAIGLLLASSTGILKISLGSPPTPTLAPLPTLPVAPTVAPASVPTVQSLPTAVNPTVAAPSATVTPTLTISDTLAQADALVFQSKFAAANAIYQQLVQADPGNALAFARWSRLLIFQAYLELRDDLSRLAVSNAETASQLAPANGEIAARLARAYAWNGNLDKALTAAQNATRLAPTSAEAYAILAEVLLGNNKLGDAETAAARALQLDPNNTEAHRSQGIILSTKQQPAAAIVELEKAAQLEPNLALRWVDLGKIYLTAKDYAKATAANQKALSLYPQATNALVGLGTAYLSEKQYSQAIESLTQATQLNNQSYSAFYVLGTTYFASDQCAQAIPAYQKAIELNPKANFAMTYLGICQLKAGNLAAAQQAAQQAAAIDPNYADTKALLASVAAASATPMPTIAPGLYVTQLRMEPPAPRAGQEVGFYVTFLNTAGGTQNYRWLVLIYKADNLRNSFGETAAQATSIPVGSVEQKALGMWKIGIGTCDNFIARVVWLDENRKATPFIKPDGQVYELPFSTCP